MGKINKIIRKKNIKIQINLNCINYFIYYFKLISFISSHLYKN